MKYNFDIVLKDVFTELGYSYAADEQVCFRLWKEIETKYSSKKRYYHNLSHLNMLLDHLTACRPIIHDWDTVLFSLFYHDIIYNVTRKDNEEKSAALATKRFQQINYPELQTEKCRRQILATRTHDPDDDPDTAFFIDADISILGQKRHVYEEYCRQIRKEYSIYPDIIYKPGRRKVITHFLQRERVFKTDVFFERYEIQARENLQWEADNL